MQFLQFANQGIRVCNDLISSYSNYNKIRPLQDNTSLKTTLASEVALISLNAIEIIAESVGASDLIQYKIKSTEIVFRGIDLITKCGHHLLSNAPDKNYLKGVVTPLAGMVRAAVEGIILQNKMYLALSPEELAKIELPIYEYVDDELKIVGRKKITREQCEDGLKTMQAFLPYSQIGEIGIKALNITKMATEVPQNVALAGGLPLAAPLAAAGPLAVIAAPIAAPIAPFIAPQENEPADLPAHTIPASALSDLDFTALHYIPEQLTNDAVFKKFNCPITKNRIRYPVGLIGDDALFERDALRNYILDNGRSPTRDIHAQLDQILQKPLAQLIIDDRLRFHSNRLKAALMDPEAISYPADPKRLAKVKKETPTLQ
ncbi:MAG: hypothetical protein H0W88_04615 [Parachlamydiaceae bacterium]|nr:hypothetical protein [Parachlamydiaceae bacterium]